MPTKFWMPPGLLPDHVPTFDRSYQDCRVSRNSRESAFGRCPARRLVALRAMLHHQTPYQHSSGCTAVSSGSTSSASVPSVSAMGIWHCSALTAGCCAVISCVSTLTRLVASSFKSSAIMHERSLALLIPGRYVQIFCHFKKRMQTLQGGIDHLSLSSLSSSLPPPLPPSLLPPLPPFQLAPLPPSDPTALATASAGPCSAPKQLPFFASVFVLSPMLCAPSRASARAEVRRRVDWRPTSGHVSVGAP